MKEKILLVEDQENLVLLNKIHLEKEGYEVVTARNGVEAQKALLLHDDIVLILLDVMMPVMDGIEFLEKSSEHIQSTGIKVCMLTAKSEKKDVKELLELGADDYLAKPIEREILLEKVKMLVRNEFDGGFYMSEADYPVSLLTKKGAVDATITGISEMELLFDCESEVDQGEIVIMLAEQLFRMLGLGFPAIFRVHRVEKEGRKFKCRSSYVGISDKEYKSIRSLTTKGVSFEK